jgi:iron complex outermembrane recepter protein
LQDQTGIAPQLNSTNLYTHFNPGVGLTYKITDNVTVYGGWSEGNRAPTPGELSCANPAIPCILDAFLVSEPPLKQVVSHTFEAGFRGNFTTDAIPGQFFWNTGVYRTNAFDDILLLATPINGFGFFSNVGETRRQGIEAGLSYKWDNLSVNLNYSYLSATFLENLTLSSNSPAANASGDIFVTPGDTIPLMPRNRVVLDLEYELTPALEYRRRCEVRQQSIPGRRRIEPGAQAAALRGRQPAQLLQAQPMGDGLCQCR